MCVTNRLSIKSHSKFVSFCVEAVEWIGLQRNAGIALATLYIAKGTDFKKLSAEDIAGITGYSRSNVSLVLSELEARGMVKSSTDSSQVGRGRKRILYSVESGVVSPMEFAVSQIMKRLRIFANELESIEEDRLEDEENLQEIIHEFREEAQLVVSSLTETHLTH